MAKAFPFRFFKISFFMLIICANQLSYGNIEKVYRSATEYDYPPFSVTNKGGADGFSVDLLKAVVREMDLKISFKIGSWNDIKNELKTGKIDVLPVVGKTPEREKYFDFTVPYIVMHGNIFVRKDNHSIKSEKDLHEKEIIVMDGDNAMEYALRKKFTDKLIAVKTYSEALTMLNSGKHDAVLAQSIVGTKIIKDLDLKNVKAVTRIDKDGIRHSKLKLRDFEQKFCFAVKEGDKELLSKLNEGLAIISASGEYNRIYKKWFPFLIENSIPSKTIFLYSMAILLPFVFLLLIVFFISVKREVKRKTESLNNINYELKVLKDKAERKSLEKSRFLANMSHEIRTPLNGVLGMIQLLEMSGLDEEQREHVNMARKSSELLLVVIDDILNYSKLEAGVVTFEKIPFKLEDTISAIVETFRIQIERKNLNINFKISEGVPDRVVGDPYRLDQILLNLIGNAVKFTDQGKIDVDVVKLRDLDPDRVLYEFAVRDTGIGIGPDKIGTLFEPYKQADDSITRKYGGTGLGLPISKELIEKMGGEIRVYSEEGQGSRFIFTLVLGRAEDDNVEQLEHGMPDFKKYKDELRVLVAEDDTVSRMIMEKFILKRGGQVVSVDNGIDAVAEAEREGFDIIFLDVEMPHMNGYEAAASIRNGENRKGEHTPIIALTAHSMNGDRDRCINSGMDDYITKPVDSKLLYDKIEEWVTLHK